jgi:4-amino-4-deoxy-L-arabinose transferase-like glycosyltransferase
MIWVFVYILALFFLTAFGAMYAYDKKKRPPLWLLALWAVFAIPVLFKAWIAVVLS